MQIPENLRLYAIRNAGNRCSKCGWNERNVVTGRVPVEVHHIDGDATNNRYSNLQVICPNCHSLTETYKNLNKDKSKRNRERYEFDNPIYEPGDPRLSETEPRAGLEPATSDLQNPHSAN